MPPALSTIKMRLVSPGGADTKSGSLSPSATTTEASLAFEDSETPVHVYWARSTEGAAAASMAVNVATPSRCLIVVPPAVIGPAQSRRKPYEATRRVSIG